MATKSVLRRIFEDLQLSVDTGENCELTPRQCKLLLDREDLLQTIYDHQEKVWWLSRLLELEGSMTKIVEWDEYPGAVEEAMKE